MNLLSIYQHLPSYINPVAFHIGSFEVRWYTIMYLAAFLTVYLLLLHRIKKQEGDFSRDQVESFLIYALVGLLVGARLGYVLFYNLPYYIQYPLEAFLPIKINGYQVLVTGYYGMSYFGGLFGVLFAGYVFCKKHKIDFLKLADFVVPAVPAGYFFGRLGNFLNGELFGRMTDRPWGMYFSDGVLRHPSQLYEAFFEGLVLFVILWFLRNNKKFAASYLLLPAYLFGYAFFRFFIEFFREPDPLRLGSFSEASLQFGLFFNFFTLSQILSLILMSSVLIYLFLQKRRI